MLKLENWRENILGCHEVVLCLPPPPNLSKENAKGLEVNIWLTNVCFIPSYKIKILTELKVETFKTN